MRLCDRMDTLALLSWYQTQARPLPWRSDPGPYGVWLSEVMAQQTRIETMLPYWRRFQERWPSPRELADASLDEVLKEWAGLGYYSRARKLHQAAALIAEHGFPSTFEGWKALPGIGEYSAAAISSIAFGADAAAVDGNVERVVCRQRGYSRDPRTAEGRREVRRVAASWLVKGRAGDWNQAVMELGARVCTPRKPSCPQCPVRVGCVAEAKGSWHELPNKPRKPKSPEVRAVALALRHEGRLLVAQRGETGLLAGLWELPQTDIARGESPRSALGRLAVDMGLAIERAEHLGDARHIFSHRKLTLQVWAVQAQGEPRRGSYEQLGWGRSDRAFSSCAEKGLLAAESARQWGEGSG